MSGLVRKATLLAVCGLAAAAAALANVPDATKSCCPDFIFVNVYNLGGGQHPDTLGDGWKAPVTGCLRGRVQVNDFNGTGIPFCAVTIKINCCDINLCTATVDGHPVACGPPNQISGTADGTGLFTFHLIGAAKNNLTAGPIFNGCGLAGADIIADAGTGPVTLCHPTVVVEDQNGSAVGGTEPDNVTDVVRLNRDVLRVGVGDPYKGRDDMNASGSLTVGDTVRANQIALRLAAVGSVGCVASGKGTYCTVKSVCP